VTSGAHARAYGAAMATDPLLLVLDWWDAASA